LHLIQVFCCLQEQSPILGWAPQPSVPKCLVSQLTLIQFKGFLGLPDEVSFVEHVLQKGLVLKAVIIADISVDLKEKYDILRRLSNVRRASVMCQLAFDWVVSPDIYEVWTLPFDPFSLSLYTSNQRLLTLGFFVLLAVESCF